LFSENYQTDMDKLLSENYQADTNKTESENQINIGDSFLS
ncbi:9809_t:CDS:2, partial [Scutellospora calospora]